MHRLLVVSVYNYMHIYFIYLYEVNVTVYVECGGTAMGLGLQYCYKYCRNASRVSAAVLEYLYT